MMHFLSAASRRFAGRSFLAVFGCFLVSSLASAQQPAVPISVPAPVLPTPYVPFKNLPPVTLDEANNGFGIAQATARAQGLQARILWVDATANIDKINTAAKIAALVQQIKSVGFNTIVLDVKPISGLVLYHSAYAPSLTNWLGKSIPVGFEPLAEFVKATRGSGVQLVASMNVFSEGQLDAPTMQSPGFANPQWQTVLYEPVLRAGPVGTTVNTLPVSDLINSLDENGERLTLYSDAGRLKSDTASRGTAGITVTLLDPSGRVAASGDGQTMTFPTLPVPVPPPALTPSPVTPNAVPDPVPPVPSPPVTKTGPLPNTLSPGSLLLVGINNASDFLQKNAVLGTKINIALAPDFHPISKSPGRKGPLMVNPNDLENQARILKMIDEVVHYGVDGVIFDDRMRYAGINADFSPQTRTDFESYVGHSLQWPDDVFQYQADSPLSPRRMVPGPLFDTWLLWRALTIRNWLAAAVARVKGISPTTTVSIYVGSTYSDYPRLGTNWAADDFTAGYRFLTPSYQKTGVAGLLDWMVTGCYYRTGTIQESLSAGRTPGESVEASGQFSNRAANDQTWVYAGLSLEAYNGRPDALRNALQAAAASTQGIMIFDLSHNIEPFWPVFQQAFAKPAQAPHAVPGLLQTLRSQHKAHKDAGIPDPAVIITGGSPGVGL